MTFIDRLTMILNSLEEITDYHSSFDTKYGMLYQTAQIDLVSPAL